MSCDLIGPRNQSVMLLWFGTPQSKLPSYQFFLATSTVVMEPIKVNYHSAKFGGYWRSGSGNIMVLVCHVILLDYVINGLYDFLGRSPSI